MNVLQLSLDSALLNEAALGHEARRRQLGYAAELRIRVPGSRLFILVRSARGVGEVGRFVSLPEGLEIHPAPPSALGFIAAAYRYGRALSRQHGLDLVSSQSPFVDGLAGWLLRSRCNTKWLVQLHTARLDNPYWLAESHANGVRAWLGKLVLRHADSVRVVSQSAAGWLQQTLGVPQERVFVIPVGTALAAEPTPLLLADAARYDVLFVGRLAFQKGVSTLLQACQHIQHTLAIVGDGPERPHLEKLAATLGLQDRVHFAGMVPYEQLPPFYARAGVVVVPSLYEPYGRVIAEAMAFGRAVVATDTDGARDLIQDGETGFIVPIQDVEALAGKISYLLSNPEVARRIGEAGRQFVTRTQDPQALRRAQVDMWLTVARWRDAVAEVVGR
jgi:glycosyltransferase involved in cell wall biosynthesis